MKKVVIKVSSMHNEESRKKAMTIVVGSSGVLSAALKGDDLRNIEITGDGVDVTKLTKLLRKKVGHAELVSVGPIKTESAEAVVVALPPNQFWPPDHYVMYHHDNRNPDSGCCIM
ncbi:putative Heavy metal transport/detoxification superfamily protein [Melia azedarach]|uniref:Heavy metal transport/detoxification superfamily protein n=2 Tax=Melia azedarach TaxID=155640 RepID=A0ACC1Z424_MELAZ|nr:putative Heavy metal transport/detoxification superfamily protein [Melia azedarach]KAJ4730277.1 putative Heavy metal transport/detoxification superfamily protein [Melia azedarach]